jgi:Ca-activated chloride channel homolog
MSFQSPWLLLALLAVPLAVALYLLAERRRMRYAVRFTNLEVLAAVAGGRSVWRRYLPPAIFLLALAAVCVGVARPERSTMVPEERATVILVIDDSLSMQARDVKPTRL